MKLHCLLTTSLNTKSVSVRIIRMNNDIQTIGSNPVGIKGRLAGRIMNIIHSNQYKTILANHVIPHLDTNDPMSILDIGCGGGKVINLFYSMLKNSKISGIDHSIDMVRLSRRVNIKGIKEERVDIIQGNASRLPFPDNFFDIVTAFDTINFWNEIDICINEIRRVLKQNAMFCIVNGYPKEGTKWWDFVKFKNEKEYRNTLLEHGFNKIEVSFKKNTIIIQAKK